MKSTCLFGVTRVEVARNLLVDREFFLCLKLSLLRCSNFAVVWHMYCVCPGAIRSEMVTTCPELSNIFVASTPRYYLEIDDACLCTQYVVCRR